MEAVLRFEERMEERDPLDVVPMVVRHQDVRFDAHPGPPFGQVVAERA